MYDGIACTFFYHKKRSTQPLKNRIHLLAALTAVMNLPGVGLPQVRPAYETETWEPGRTLIWAHPGQDGALDDPNNWHTADGTTAAQPPASTPITATASTSLACVLCGCGSWTWA